MAYVYTTLLLGGTFSTGSGVLEAEVPAGYVWDVRDIEIICNGDANVSYAGVTVQHDGSLYGLVVVTQAIPFIGGDKYQWEGRALVPSGALLSCASLGVVEYNASITGYQLTLP